MQADKASGVSYYFKMTAKSTCVFVYDVLII